MTFCYTFVQLSPEKFPPAADRNKYRDPKSDIVQRMSNHGMKTYL